MPKKFLEKGEAFMIMKKVHFQKNQGLGFFSITTDGTYLYIYVSAINGGMFKVGTGRNSSIAGKIYLEREIYSQVNSKVDEVNWVYLNGKLYLKNSAKDPSSLEVINPETFKSESIMELNCPALFGHQALVNLNRNSILLTDGQKLYFLGKQLKITRARDQHEQNEKENKKKEKTVEQEKEKKEAPMGKKKRKVKNPEPEKVEQVNQDFGEKIVQYVLYEFNVSEDVKEQNPECDEELAEELYISFNNYFTKDECRRALDLADNDISEATQWLVEQGEKERTMKILYPVQQTIIGEAEISNNFNERNIRSSNEIATKENSIIHIQNVNESIWTMDYEEITCYSETGIKIFSKNPKDEHLVNGLKTTHVKTVDLKFARNPEYTIVYDPSNEIFFTFHWPTDGAHYFPTSVFVGSDFKSCAEISYQKRASLSSQAPTNLE